MSRHNIPIFNRIHQRLPVAQSDFLFSIIMNRFLATAKRGAEVGKAQLEAQLPQPPQLRTLRCALIFYFETSRKLRCGLNYLKFVALKLRCAFKNFFG